MGKRLDSIDALRGFDMLFIMGLSTFIFDICAIFPGGDKFWLAEQMGHAGWHGLTHHDTIFPLFLFISGMTFPFSLSSKRAHGVKTEKIWLHVWRRALVLVLLGLVYGGLLKFNFATLRWPSVLGRIGLAWLGAAIVWMTVKKTGWRAAIAAGLLIGYWVLHLFVAPDAPEGTSPLTKEGSMACYIDRLIMPQHLLSKGVYDPEGLMGTFPAIVTALLGMFTGDFVKRKDISGGRKTIWMLIGAVVLLGLGLLWSTVFPINKKLWTSSFVLVVGAYSVALFALFYYIMDVRGWKKWAKPLRVIGLNSITIYMAQRIVSFGGINKFFFEGLAGLFPDNLGKLVLDATYILVCWLFLYFLYKKRVFLKV